MKTRVRRGVQVLCRALAVMLAGNLAYSAAPKALYPAASNSDSQGRTLNRRVDVKVIVNKGLAEGHNKRRHMDAGL
jgi:hypothetical protein